jgi:predicted ribosomally synthesized peptide with nif11-like leader
MGMIMSKKNVEELLIAGGTDESIRGKYDALKSKEEFVALAQTEGYVFSVQDLEDVLRESGDAFESFGNPPKRVIWWH